MILNLNGVQKAILASVPAIASVAIATLPSQAATLSFSGAAAAIDNFSTPASDVNTFTDTNTNTVSTAGIATANANADATFSSTSGVNLSTSDANGQGTQYLGTANSVAQLVGNFFVTAGNPFSFSFNAILGLQAVADTPSETATAAGSVVFRLFDTKTGDLFDSFTLTGLLDSSSSADPFKFDANSNVQANVATTLFPDGIHVALVDGTYARSFDADTYLTLEETKLNFATVQGVPEPSDIAGCVLAIGVFSGLMYRRSRSKATQIRWGK